MQHAHNVSAAQERQTLTSMTVSEDAVLVATGSAHGSVHVTDVSAAPRAATLASPRAAVAQPSALSDDVVTSALHGHAGPVYGVAFSPDRRLLYSCGCDGTVRLWSTELGANLVIWEDHATPVWAVAVSGQGHWLASGASDMTCRLWCSPLHYWQAATHGAIHVPPGRRAHHG